MNLDRRVSAAFGSVDVVRRQQRRASYIGSEHLSDDLYECLRKPERVTFKLDLLMGLTVLDESKLEVSGAT